MNNRQNGRRRGRGGQQARQPGAPDRGSRLDNRARGNAAQLLEKYKTLARDAQMQGDRVNTEYYLQFADHYFRVLSESRSRFEEQRRSREEYRDDFGGAEDESGDGAQRSYQQRDEGGDESWDEGEGDRADASGEAQRAPQPRRQERAYQGNGNSEARERGEYREPRQPREASGEGRAPRERARRNPASAANGNVREGTAAAADDTAPARIEMDRVPPSLTAEPVPAEAVEGDAAAKPRRRTRRPRAEAAPAEV